MPDAMTYDSPADLTEYRARAKATPFPPTRWEHIQAYRHEEVMSGYLARRCGDLEPSDFHSSSFRWGWVMAEREITGKDDGFGPLRVQQAEYMRQRHAEMEALRDA